MDGWTERITYLEVVIRQLESLDKISHQKLEDLVTGYKEFEAQVKEVKNGKKLKKEANCTIY